MNYTEIASLISALATIILVYVTSYYAKLVKLTLKEMEKNREIDFIEKKFEKFYYPIKYALSSIVAEDDEYQYRDEQADSLNKIFKDVQKYNYLASPELRLLINKFPYIYRCWNKPSEFTMGRGEAWEELRVLLPRMHKLIDKDIKENHKILDDLINEQKISIRPTLIS